MTLEESLRKSEESQKNLMEIFEDKEGRQELANRLNNLTDKQRSLCLYMIFGMYTSSTHAEWYKFRDSVDFAITHTI